MGFIFNAAKRLIKTVLKLSLYLALIVTIITVIPNLPPYTKFSSIEVSPVQPRVGPLALNSALNNAGRSYSGKLLGPEAFQVHKGELYTSLATGEIVKLSPEGHVTFVTTVGQPCTGLIHEHICGRPLGIQIDEKDESLYVADAYHGIWKVNLKTNSKQLLISPIVEIEKRQPKLFNSIALAKNGDFYWTDSSSDFHLRDGAISLMTDPTGRLFHYDAAKNQSKVLLDKLWFPNGVVLSPNNDFIVVSESFRARIMKYYISGPKKGQSEVFVDGLPGVPDNSRALPDGSGLLVAMYTVFEEDRPPLSQLLAATPVVRKVVARLHRLVEIPFEYLNTIYPHIVFEEIVYFIGHFKSLSGVTPALSGLLQMDWDGNIVAGYYNTDKTLGHISDAIVFNDKLYTGSPHLQDFIGTVPVPPVLKKAFATTKKSEAPKVEKNAQKAKPVQQAPIKKTEEKPKAKVEEKPKVEIKPKVEEKPKTATKPVEKESPKVVKPAPPAAPKPPQQAKPAATKQEAKTAPPAPPAPAPLKPAPPTKKPGPPKTPTITEFKATAPKPEVKTTPPPKPAEKTTPPPPKKTPTETENEAPKKAEAALKQDAPQTAEMKPKEAPKVAKPVEKESPKVVKPAPPAAPKPPQQAKPAATKQEAKTAPPAPPAPAPLKPAPPTKKPGPPKTPTKTEPKATAPKPEVKTTPPPKPAEKTTPPPPNKTPTETKNEAPKKAEPALIQDAPQTAEMKPKPIKEEIPSDTVKPAKETLKVIKKDGPAEIHVAN